MYDYPKTLSIILGSLALWTCGVLRAEIIYVPDDYETIQDAIDAASDGDEIIVAPGIYTSIYENVVDMHGKAIWLHSSDGPEVTIIDGENRRRGIICRNNESLDTIIEGFTIDNCIARAYSGGGMLTSSASPTIINCTFYNNTADDGAGLCRAMVKCCGWTIAHQAAFLLIPSMNWMPAMTSGMS